jgi:TonB-linked SusC/RagA family outer membrane protein
MKRALALWILGLIVSAQVFAQTRNLSGKVTDATTGEALIGVNVSGKGTTTGTVTDIDGNYTLEMPKEVTTLTFSYVGYTTIEKPITSLTINVNMAADQQIIDEVVITAYGELKKDQLTGSVSTVTNKKLDGVTQLVSFDQMLQGRAPGLLVLGGSGQPGSPAGRVQIRGAGSITGSNDPIYIVDGIPLSYSNYSALNSSDFESVTVLKDAATASMYGSRGANGIIVVKTKQGKDGKVKINLRNEFGFTSPTLRGKFSMMNSKQKLEFENLLAKIGYGVKGEGGIYGPDGTTPNQAVYDSLSNINTDWNKLIFNKAALNHLHEINFSGAKDKMNYYTSINYLKQDGQITNSSFNRTAIRANIGFKPVEKIKVQINNMFTFRNSSYIERENEVNLRNPVAGSFLLNSYQAPYDKNGNLVPFNNLSKLNPLDKKAYSSVKEIRVLSSINFQATLAPGLVLNSISGLDYANINNKRTIEPTSLNATGTPNNRGSLTNGNTVNYGIVSTNFLQYDKTFKNKHYLMLNGGVEYYTQKTSTFQYTAYGLDPKTLNPTAGTTANGFIPIVSKSTVGYNLFGTFTNAVYTYDGRYTVVGGYRRDGSSKFGENKRYGNFWYTGVSWNIHNEAFLKNSKVIDELKLSYVYGTLGNQEGIGNYQRLGVFSTLGNYNGVTSTVQTRPENKDLKWEVMGSHNLALDFSFWDNRLYGSTAFYNNITSDLFVSQQLSRTTGFIELEVNSAKVRNRGIEFMLGGDVVRNKTGDIYLNLEVNFTQNWNKVLDLGPGVNEFEQGTGIIEVGKPLGTHYEVGWAGVDPATGKPFYFDKSGNITDVYSADNRTSNHGTYDAPRFGGGALDLYIKGFGLEASFAYQHGSKIYNNEIFFTQNPLFAQFNQSTEMLNVWTTPGQITNIQNPLYSTQFSSKFIEDGSFLRLRDLTLSYDFYNVLNKNTPVKAIKLYVRGTNLLTFTKYTGLDPEISNNLATYGYPAARTYTFGVNIGF